VVVLCDWAGELLTRNGIPPGKLSLSRHGLPASQAIPSEATPTPSSDRDRLRIAFLGRLHPTKGLHVLLRAITSIPGAALELHVFGIPEDAHENAYTHSLRKLANGDARIRFCPPLASDTVPTALRGYDILAVPSQWLETGPLVVLEAFAAGIPVIASKLGGIAELVTDGIDGILVEPELVESWSAALRRFSEQPDLLPQLRRGVRPPRPIEAVANDMQRIYCGLLRQT
jgi:glycosyltransferase involved in cell wall biosynthesis